MKKTWIVSREFSELLLRAISREVVNKICLPMLIGLRKQHLNETIGKIKRIEIWSNDINRDSSIKRVSPVGGVKGPVFQFIDG